MQGDCYMRGGYGNVRRIGLLTAMRFVAASIVVIFHFGRSVTGGNGLLSSGPQMVTFFFVLSGFVMFLAHHDRSCAVWSYYGSRGCRILPVYILALLLSVGIQVVRGQIDTSSVLLGLLLLQAWVPTVPQLTNPPGWSISVEIFFYLIFPILCRAIQKYPPPLPRFLLLVFSVWAVTQGGLSYLLEGGYVKSFPSAEHDYLHFFPLFHLCSFFLGISGAMLYTRFSSINYEAAGSRFLSLVAVLISGAAVIIALGNLHVFSSFMGYQLLTGGSLLAPIFLLFIFSCAWFELSRGGICLPQTVQLLGEASFALYILQDPVYAIYTHLSNNFFSDPRIEFLVFFGLLVCVSLSIHCYFELPIQQMFRNKMRRVSPPLTCY